MSDSAFTLLEVGFHAETERAFVVDVLSREEHEQAYEFATAYLETASRMLENAYDHIHLAFDPSLSVTTGRGHSHRHVTVAGTNEKLAKSVSEATGQEIGTHDLIVIFGPQSLTYRGKLDVLERVVAGDLSVIFDVAYPVECSGGIVAYMPMLTHLAARILIPGNPEVQNRVGGTGKQSVTNVTANRIDMAISLVIREEAERYFSTGTDNDGSVGHLMFEKELIELLAQEVGREARTQLDHVESPLPLDMIVAVVHNTIAQTMRNVGIPVTDKAPVSRLSVGLS